MARGCLIPCHTEGGPSVQQRAISDEFSVRLFASLRETDCFWDSPVKPHEKRVVLLFASLTLRAINLVNYSLG